MKIIPYICSKTNQEINGTSLQGYVEISYKKLIEVFGKPNVKVDGYKTDAEWLIMTPVGIATIYNYKDGKNYCGKAGKATSKIVEWHIGGRSDEVVNFIREALNIT